MQTYNYCERTIRCLKNLKNFFIKTYSNELITEAATVLAAANAAGKFMSGM